ncbi:MAG: hypothetical protein R6W68_16040 [Ignavibacteriaceae bacterium]
MDESYYDKLFIKNKNLVIETIKSLRELEASCDLLLDADSESKSFYTQKLAKSLLEFKTAKFELVTAAYFEGTPDPYNPVFDEI